MHDRAGVLLRQVRKSFGSVDVIHGIDLDIPEGSFTVFVGPSGCGKSTLLRMIAGLEEVTEGEIRIRDRDVTDLDPSARGIAMVFQSYALYPHMTVRDNLGFGLKMANIPADRIEVRVDEAARILKIEHLLDRRPGQLSGGQRQRVAIGRAIVREPEVFLFDEPLSNLDAELRVTMRVEIARLHRELGNTMIYVTHDQVEAMTLADQIVVLRGGKIEQVGTPREVYERPENTFVAGFIGSPRMNLLTGMAGPDGAVEVAGQALPVRTAAGVALTIGIRPEHLKPVPEGAGRLQARVDFTEYLGGTEYLFCALDDGQQLVAEYEPGEGGPRSVGARIGLDITHDRLHLFDAAGLRMEQDRPVAA